jgi:hypothetical protein
LEISTDLLYEVAGSRADTWEMRVRSGASEDGVFVGKKKNLENLKSRKKLCFEGHFTYRFDLL